MQAERFSTEDFTSIKGSGKALMLPDIRCRKITKEIVDKKAHNFGSVLSLLNKYSEHFHVREDVSINECALHFLPFIEKFPGFRDERDLFVGMALLYDSPKEFPDTILGEINLRWVGNWLVVCVEQPSEDTISHGLYLSKKILEALAGMFSGAKSGLVIRGLLAPEDYEDFGKKGWTLARVKLVQTNIPELEDIVVAPECEAFLRGLGVHLVELHPDLLEYKVTSYGQCMWHFEEPEIDIIRDLMGFSKLPIRIHGVSLEGLKTFVRYRQEARIHEKYEKSLLPFDLVPMQVYDISGDKMPKQYASSNIMSVCGFFLDFTEYLKKEGVVALSTDEYHKVFNCIKEGTMEKSEFPSIKKCIGV